MAPEPRSDPAGSRTFVGREHEMAELADALDHAVRGQGRLVLIGGEPGIGKSRLVDEFGTEARRRGARVIWGRCWEAGGAPPYWPWVQVVRAAVRDLSDDELRGFLGSGGPEVAQMVPEIRSRLPDLPEPPSLDPESARFRLFDAAAGLLARTAEGGPIVVVLDDLQVADTPSLLLLRFLAGVIPDATLLIVATFRTTEVEPGDELAATIADIDRVPANRRIVLAGLSEGEVGRLVEVTGGVPIGSDQVAAIHDDTAGNPLFLGEIVRLLAAEGRLDQIGTRAGTAAVVPREVHDVIGRRLLRLSDACVATMTLAAVLGRDFSLDMLRRLSDGSAEEMLAALEEATSARIVAEVPGAPGWWRFSHALIRDAMYDDLSVTQRLRLHRRAGAVLEEAYGHDLEPHLGELAHHYVQAAPAGDPEKAVEYARRAGEQAVRLLAYEEAIRLFGAALHALELGPPDEHARCELLLSMGDAAARAGDLSTAHHTLLTAAELATRLGLPEALARAAVGYAGRFIWVRAGHDPNLVPLLERAAAALGEVDHPLRVRVLGRLACALRDRHDREPRWSLASDAERIARRIGDPDTLGFALCARWAAIWEPDTAEERLALATEAVRVAAEGGDKEVLQQALLGRMSNLFELGRIPEAHAELDAMERLAAELRQPSAGWLSQASRGLVTFFEGRLDDAARIDAEAFETGGGSIQSDPVSHRAMHAFALAKERGGMAEAEPLLRDAADAMPWYPMLRCALASVYLDLGRTDDARAQFARLAENRFGTLPVDNEWLLALTLIAEVAIAFADPRMADLYDLLAPYASMNAVGIAEGCTGSVSRALGLLVAAMGRVEDAVGHLEEALEANRRMGSKLWSAHTMHDLALVLRSRDAAGDEERADALLEEAGALCRELGMTVLGERIASALDERSSAADTAPAHTRSAGARGTFRREGDVFSIAFEGDAFRLKDAKGLRHLARLLAEPGREFHALDLVALEAGGATGGRARGEPPLDGIAATDAGAVLDPAAKAAYRSRLDDLEEAIADAEALGDAERAARARDERDEIARELSGALGLGGRDRVSASSAERARLNVTRAIRSGVARIAEESPALGHHLDRTVRTGTFCSYVPDPRAPLDWRT